MRLTVSIVGRRTRSGGGWVTGQVITVWLLLHVTLLIGGREVPVVYGREMSVVLVGRHLVGGGHVVDGTVVRVWHVGRAGPGEVLSRVHYQNGVEGGSAWCRNT